MEIYGKANATREVEKSIVLPEIARSSETIDQQTVTEAGEEYKDSNAINILNTVNSKASLRSWDTQNKQKAKYHKKSKLIAKNVNKDYKDTSVNFATPNDSHYVERVYKKQKWSFVHLDRGGRSGFKGSKMPKSQTRKSILPILAPDHYEALLKQQNMVIKFNQEERNGDKSLNVLLQQHKLGRPAKHLN